MGNETDFQKKKGEPDLVCEMMTRTMELGREKLALKYGEAKKQLYQSERTGDQASIDSDMYRCD